MTASRIAIFTLIPGITAQCAFGAETGSRLLSLSLEELGTVKFDTVFGASKVSEKVTDAPASVTIVTRSEIARFGYRTLSDILQATRSFDVSYNRSYSFTGVRGFNSVDDYGSHTLLLVDGHRMNDPIYDTVAVGTEGLLDVDLIERVELIRGPGSALYGSNAVLAVINVVTRSGASVNGVEASTTGGSFETYSGRLTLGKKLANGFEYLFSGTTYATQGPAHLYFREFDAPETNHGIASHQDGDRFWSVLGKVSYGNFTLQAGYVTRDKDVPTAGFGSVFNEPSPEIDSRGFVELRYLHETANGWTLSARASSDTYDYHSQTPYDVEGARVTTNESSRARWSGAEVGASRTFFNCFRFALGVEVSEGTKLQERSYDENPFITNYDSHLDRSLLGAYADGRWEITKTLSLSAGARWDRYDGLDDTWNPHAALIWKPRESTSLKLLYGEAYPTPNVSQLDYLNVDRGGVPELKAEAIRSYEAVIEHYWGAHWRGSASVFRNEFGGLINYTSNADGLAFPFNSHDARVDGVETEIEGKWDHGLRLRASYTRQDAVNETTGERLINSPENVVKAQVSVPLLRDKIFASAELIYASERPALGGRHSNEMWQVNATLFSRELAPGLEFSASVYNLLGQKYRTPASDAYLQNTLEQDGHTFRLKVSYKF